MDFETYLSYFESILTREDPPAPYQNPDYKDYTKLNWSRTNRWLKKGTLTPEMVTTVMSIDSPQQWIVITEPWCGDAAHSVPFIQMIALQNPLISIAYELRDAEPFRINSYLTGSSKSIPKLVIKNGEGIDLATWGPRPAPCQLIYEDLIATAADFETVKTSLQLWYNADDGKTLQQELTALLKGL